MDPHRLAELRSLAYHRVIAQRLHEDRSILERARARVAAWLAEDGRARPYAERWKEVLDGPDAQIARVLVEDSEAARALRQATPFAGALDARERWRLWREVKDRLTDHR